MKYVQFLDNTFPDWKYFNVYDNDTREQVGSFTKYNRPTYKYIWWKVQKGLRTRLNTTVQAYTVVKRSMNGGCFSMLIQRAYVYHEPLLHLPSIK